MLNQIIKNGLASEKIIISNCNFFNFPSTFMLLYLKGFTVDQLSELNVQQVQAIQPTIRESLPPAKAQALHAIENEERGNPRKNIFTR